MSKVSLLSATAIVAILSGGAPVAAKQPVHTPYNVLWNQNSNFGYGVVSDNFSANYSSHDSAAADDFVVPKGQSWHITEVDVTVVYYNGSGPASSEVVTFYSNTNNGKPGRVRQGPFTVNCNDNGGSFQCVLPKPVRLPSGAWWVSVVANCSFVSCGQWDWITNTVLHRQRAVWQKNGSVRWLRLKYDLAFTLICKKR